jgi:hypothetical protein
MFPELIFAVFKTVTVGTMQLGTGGRHRLKRNSAFDSSTLVFVGPQLTFCQISATVFELFIKETALAARWCKQDTYWRHLMKNLSPVDRPIAVSYYIVCKAHLVSVVTRLVEILFRLA